MTCVGGDAGYPAQQRIHIFGNVFITITRGPNGEWTAESQVPTRFGPIRVAASASEETVGRAILAVKGSKLARQLAALREMSMVSGDDIEVSGFFDDVGNWFKHAVQTISRSKVFRQVSDTIANITQNPIFQTVVSAIPYVGPAINAGLQLGTHAASLLARAKGGDPAARQGVSQIVRQAKGGSVPAQQALAALQHLNQHPDFQAGKPWDAVKSVATMVSDFVPQSSAAKGVVDMVSQGLNMVTGSDGAHHLPPPPTAHTPSTSLPREVSDAQYDHMVEAFRHGLDLVAGADGVYRLAARQRFIPPRYGLPYPPRLPRVR